MSAVHDLPDTRLTSWCDLPRSPLAASIARRWVSAMLASWPVRPARDQQATIIELASELVTNAVQHSVPCARGGSGIRVNLRACSTMVWLAVCDPDPTLPSQRTPDFFAESGRGLFLVDAQADHWGAVRHDDGKYVWFSLECLDGLPSTAERSSGSYADRSHQAP